MSRYINGTMTSEAFPLLQPIRCVWLLSLAGEGMQHVVKVSGVHASHFIAPWRRPQPGNIRV